MRQFSFLVRRAAVRSGPVVALLALLLGLSGWFCYDSIWLYPSFIHAWAQADWLAIVLKARARGYDFFSSRHLQSSYHRWCEGGRFPGAGLLRRPAHGLHRPRCARPDAGRHAGVRPGRAAGFVWASAPGEWPAPERRRGGAAHRLRAYLKCYLRLCGGGRVPGHYGGLATAGYQRPPEPVAHPAGARPLSGATSGFAKALPIGLFRCQYRLGLGTGCGFGSFVLSLSHSSVDTPPNGHQPHIHDD